MMTVWNDTTLGEFLTLQRGHDLPATQQRPGSVPVMGSAGQNGFHDVAKAKGPGVTIGRSGVGSMGVVTYCPTDFWPHNTVLYVTDFRGNDQRFAYYFLKQLDLRRYNSGSAQASLNRNFVYPISVRVPDLEAQRRIADILGSLDDKIDLNRRMNETLEALARRLFKSWFVDFDPVHAKAALRRQHPKLSNAELSRRALPNMAPAIAELFPDSFEDSTLGPIPKGWRTGTIGHEFTLTMGQSPPGSTYNDIGEGLPFYQGKADFQTRFPDRRIYCIAPTRYAQQFDTLVSVRAPVGAINMASEDCAIGRGLAAVRHYSGGVSYTYYAIQQQGEAFQRFEADGTVFGSINKSNFQQLPHVVPETAVIDAFESHMASNHMQIYALTLGTESLARVRDKLLPRLLSGDLVAL